MPVVLVVVACLFVCIHSDWLRDGPSEILIPPGRCPPDGVDGAGSLQACTEPENLPFSPADTFFLLFRFGLPGRFRGFITLAGGNLPPLSAPMSLFCHQTGCDIPPASDHSLETRDRSPGALPAWPGRARGDRTQVSVQPAPLPGTRLTGEGLLLAS